jgi:hypothetical protein
VPNVAERVRTEHEKSNFKLHPFSFGRFSFWIGGERGDSVSDWLIGRVWG